MPRPQTGFIGPSRFPPFRAVRGGFHNQPKVEGLCGRGPHGTFSMIDPANLAIALGGEVTSGDEIRAPGPGHSPEDRSLKVKIDPRAPDGFVANSFSGDDWKECKDYVREKAGLGPFKPNGRSRKGSARAATSSSPRGKPQRRQRTERGSSGPKGIVEAQYDYRDENGALLYQIIRLKPKGFYQRRPDGNGGWDHKLDGVRRVIYRWPEILQFPDGSVFVCEGEKDADRVASLGHCATTVASGKWTEDCVKALAGRHIMVLQDNDGAGEKKALAAAQAMHGVATSIRVVLLPDLKPGGDVSDWLDADPQRAGRLVDVCLSVPEWTPAKTAPIGGKFDADELRALYSEKLLQIRNDRGQGIPSAFAIDISNTMFGGLCYALGDHVKGRAQLNIIAADVGSGKTTCAFAFIAALTEYAETHQDWPAGVIYSCEQIAQCDAAYRELSKLLPDQVAVWSREHDPKCKDRERLQEPAAEFTQAELIDYPVIVVTHEFLRVGGDKVRLWADGDQKRYRSLTIIDERPEWTDVFDLTIRQAHEIKEELVAKGASEIVNQSVAKLCDLMAKYELNDENRIKVIEDDNSVLWFTGIEAKGVASKYASITRLRELFSFAKALTQCCAFSAPSGNITHFVGWTPAFQIHPGSVLLDATATFDAAHSIAGGRQGVSIEPVKYDNLEIVHVPRHTPKQLRPFFRNEK